MDNLWNMPTECTKSRIVFQKVSGVNSPHPQQHLLLREERRARKVREGPPSLKTWLRQWTFFVIYPRHSGRSRLPNVLKALLCLTIVCLDHIKEKTGWILWGFPCKYSPDNTLVSLPCVPPELTSMYCGIFCVRSSSSLFIRPTENN